MNQWNDWHQQVMNLFKKKKKSIEYKTIKQMSEYVFEHADDFSFLANKHSDEAAFIVSRSFFERIVSLLFILKDKSEVKSRAKRFYYSSRIRELLRVQILVDYQDEAPLSEKDRRYLQRQEKYCMQHDQCTLSEWISRKITWYKQQFDRIAIHYVSQRQLDRDHRRKGWCYIETKVNSSLGQSIGNFSDLVQYTLGKNGMFLYHYFYGMNSLYTHGYDTDPQWMLGLNPTIRCTKYWMNQLLFQLTSELHQFFNQPFEDSISARAPRLPKIQSFPPLLPVNNSLNRLQERFKKLIQSYEDLKKAHRFLAARLLVRTIFNLTVNICFLQREQDLTKPRVFRYQLSSRIQWLSNIKLLLQSIPESFWRKKERQSVDSLLCRIDDWLQSARDQYDALIQWQVPHKASRRDKRRRNWFVEWDKNIKNTKQLARYALQYHPLFCWQFEDGFHSVHVHGINLNHRYRLAGHDLIFTHDISDLDLCNTLVHDNIKDVQQYIDREHE